MPGAPLSAGLAPSSKAGTLLERWHPHPQGWHPRSGLAPSSRAGTQGGLGVNICWASPTSTGAHGPGGVLEGGSTPRQPHLGLLQAPVNEPEVLAELLLADGLPIDADPLTHLHQVRGAGGAEQERGAQSGTVPPAPPNPPDPPHSPVKARLQPVVAEDALSEGAH